MKADCSRSFPGRHSRVRNPYLDSSWESSSHWSGMDYSRFGGEPADNTDHQASAKDDRAP